MLFPLSIFNILYGIDDYIYNLRFTYNLGQDVEAAL